MQAQPGYDALADVYDEAFPEGYSSALERHAVSLFATELIAAGRTGRVVDVGCGTGHVTNDLAARGLDVEGVDPSEAMLSIARAAYPDLRFTLGDASLTSLDDDGREVAAIVSRFSLIHVAPSAVPAVLDAWASRLEPGGRVMVAFQCSDAGADPVVEFDHRVAPAWRWHPDAMAGQLEAAGLAERWRLVARPGGASRFAECHLVHERVD